MKNTPQPANEKTRWYKTPRGIEIIVGSFATVIAAVLAAVITGIIPSLFSDKSSPPHANRTSPPTVQSDPDSVFVAELKPVRFRGRPPSDGFARTRNRVYQHAIFLEHDCSKSPSVVEVAYDIPSGMRRLIGTLELTDDTSLEAGTAVIIGGDERSFVDEASIHSAMKHEMNYDISRFRQFSILSEGQCEKDGKLKVVFGDLRLTK